MSNKLMAKEIYEQSSNIILEQMSVSKDAPRFTVARMNSEEEGLQHPFIIYIVQHNGYVAFHIDLFVSPEQTNVNSFMSFQKYNIDLTGYIEASQKIVKHHFSIGDDKLFSTGVTIVPHDFDYKDAKKVENLVVQSFNNAQSEILVQVSKQ